MKTPRRSQVQSQFIASNVFWVFVHCILLLYTYKWYSSSIGRIYYINKFILFSLFVVEYIKAIQLVTYMYIETQEGCIRKLKKRHFLMCEICYRVSRWNWIAVKYNAQKTSRHCLTIHNIDISLTLCGKHTAIRHQEPEIFSGLAAFSFLSQWLVQNFLFLFISFVIWVKCNDKG